MAALSQAEENNRCYSLGVELLTRKALGKTGLTHNRNPWKGFFSISLSVDASKGMWVTSWRLLSLSRSASRSFAVGSQLELRRVPPASSGSVWIESGDQRKNSCTANVKESYEWNPCSKIPNLSLCHYQTLYYWDIFWKWWCELWKKYGQKNNNTLLFTLWYFRLLSYGHSDQTCSDLQTLIKWKKKNHQKSWRQIDYLHFPHFQKHFLSPRAADIISLSCLSQTSDTIRLNRA